ncbi:serine hydrolase [Anaerolineales bacterium HSG6]|nr:serine hydrolase [Anaerolineales bacterium HSG6]
MINPTAIAETIQHQIDREPFSGTVFVQENWQTIFAKGYGLANRAENIPNTAQTRFGIASGCKIFAAVAICQLVEQGLISFETRLADCLDIAFPNFDPNVTVHQLSDFRANFAGLTKSKNQNDNSYPTPR